MIESPEIKTRAAVEAVEIKTPFGMIEVRELRAGYWVWSTPNGYGGLEDTKIDALRAAVRAQGLRPEDYGIKSY